MNARILVFFGFLYCNITTYIIIAALDVNYSPQTQPINNSTSTANINLLALVIALLTLTVVTDNA